MARITSFIRSIFMMLFEFFRRLSLLLIRLLHMFRYPLFIAGILLLAFFFLYAFLAQPYSTPPKYSIYSENWDGSSLLYAYTSSQYPTKAVLVSIEDFASLGSDATLFIISPERQYSVKERIAIRQFVSGGGTLFLAGSRGPAKDLAEEFNLRYSNGTIVDYLAHNRRQDFPVLPYAVGGDAGLVFMKFPAAITLHPALAAILVASSPESYVDLDMDAIITPQDLKGPFAPAIAMGYGNGMVVAISDSDVFTNDMLPRGDNLRFASSLLSAYSRGTIAFDESHRVGESDSILVLLHTFREKMRDPQFMLLLALATFGMMLIAHRLLHSTEQRHVEAQADLKVHPYRDMVWDIVSNARLRAEPYTWLVLMQYDRFRDRLLAGVDPFRRQVPNEKLAKLAAKKHGFDESALRALLARCERIKAGEITITSFGEANDLCYIIDDYISKFRK